MSETCYLTLKVMKINPSRAQEWAVALNNTLGTEFADGQEVIDLLKASNNCLDCDTDDFSPDGARTFARALVNMDKDAVWWMVEQGEDGEPGTLCDYNYELGLYTRDCDMEGEPIVGTDAIVQIIDDPDATLESVREGIRALYGIAWRQWREDWVENGDKREREALAREEAEVLESIKAAFRNQS